MACAHSDDRLLSYFLSYWKGKSYAELLLRGCGYEWRTYLPSVHLNLKQYVDPGSRCCSGTP